MMDAMSARALRPSVRRRPRGSVLLALALAACEAPSAPPDAAVEQSPIPGRDAPAAPPVETASCGGARLHVFVPSSTGAVISLGPLADDRGEPFAPTASFGAGEGEIFLADGGELYRLFPRAGSERVAYVGALADTGGVRVVPDALFSGAATVGGLFGPDLRLMLPGPSVFGSPFVPLRNLAPEPVMPGRPEALVPFRPRSVFVFGGQPLAVTEDDEVLAPSVGDPLRFGVPRLDCAGAAPRPRLDQLAGFAFEGTIAPVVLTARSGDSVHTITFIPRTDGTVCWTLLEALPLRADTGEPVRASAIFTYAEAPGDVRLVVLEDPSCE